MMMINQCMTQGRRVHFLKQKKIFHVISENIEFLHVNNMRNFSLFIEQEISNKN